jgi:hypothetical protein
MKNIRTTALALGISSAVALVMVSGCVVEPDGRVRAGIVVAAPPLVVDADVIPDDYVWDGYEYVGVVGGQYYYLGPGNVWLVCEPWRLDRFHAWVGIHPDWHGHAVRNDHYRYDRHGHYRPWHDNH